MVLTLTILFEESLLRDQSSSSILEEQQRRVPVEQEEVEQKRMELDHAVSRESKYRLLLGKALQIQR